MTAVGIDRNAVQAQALAMRLFTAGLNAAEVFAAYLGLRLGLYRALASGGPATAPQLAERAGIAPRYAREWLEQQAACGVLEVDDGAKDPDRRLYLLPPGHAEALLDPEGPHFIAPMVLLPVGAMVRVLPRLLDAYRTGSGIPYADYGEDFHTGQGLLNRAIFTHQLTRWIERALPGVHGRLRAGCRIADVACGAGWSSLALARAYPRSRVDGFDLHEPCIDEARRQAADCGLADRVAFHVGSGDAPVESGRYGLVCIFDALHDMPRPVEVLHACRRLLAPGGSLLLMEPKAAEAFTAPAGETERFLYAVSLLHCLPVGLSTRPSIATGTVIRPATVRQYARDAGFARVDIVAVEHRFHRLYHLHTSDGG